ncbi:MAG: hypothetical protein Q8O26_20550 [Phreatobacter sp.]|uniref:hypothetical protein n=1 Tax=Phreatobacter sp. TaxID=1966341 RepID=UPI0027349DA5|nr:hypothetical protein [Phreatobacter sp.]MDP2804268.1 hypothetical protein [Phreatobacter sp.]
MIADGILPRRGLSPTQSGTIGRAHALGIDSGERMAFGGQTATAIAGPEGGRLTAPYFDTLSPEGRPSRQAQVLVTSRPGRPNGFARMVAKFIDDAMLNGSVIRRDGATGMTRR